MKGLLLLPLIASLSFSMVDASAYAVPAPSSITICYTDGEVTESEVTDGEESTEGDESLDIEGVMNELESNRGESGVSEDEADEFIGAPEAEIDKQTGGFIDSIGGKILGILLKILSVGLVLTVAADLCFVAVPITQGIFLSLERSGIPIVSNEAHECAGVPREKRQNAGGSRGGYGGGYGGGYDGGYGEGGGYETGGRNGKQEAPGIKGYIKKSIVKMVLVLAFAVFCLSGAYVHLAYVIGDAVSGAIKNI